MKRMKIVVVMAAMLCISGGVMADTTVTKQVSMDNTNKLVRPTANELLTANPELANTGVSSQQVVSIVTPLIPTNAAQIGGLTNAAAFDAAGTGAGAPSIPGG